jgi:hypothetical protein
MRALPLRYISVYNVGTKNYNMGHTDTEADFEYNSLKTLMKCKIVNTAAYLSVTIWYATQKQQNIVVEWLTHQFRIREVPGSKLGLS